jgi:hypothetical protein
MAPPLLSLLSPYDIKVLGDLARDPRLSSKLNKKLEIIKSILEPRGFAKFCSGTNRVVYKFLEDQSFLIKVALDKTGLSDNPMEFKNQFLLAPFVTKVFESTPCGAVGLFERVEPITSRQEFISIAEDVFDLLNGEFYYYPGPKCFCINDPGSTYTINLEDRFENISMHSIFRMRTLLKVAQILNDNGYTINIPNSLLCKVKRK